MKPNTPPCAAACRWLVLSLMGLCSLAGCQRDQRDESERIIQRLNQQAAKSDALRQGMQYLAQTTPTNRANLLAEIRVLLNTWLKSVDVDSAAFTPSKLLEPLDPRALQRLGSDHPDRSSFSLSDISHLYQCRLMRQLSQWIVDGPVHDRLLQPLLADKMATLEPAEALKLENALKLFDWTIRNVKLAAVDSSQVQIKTPDPRAPIQDGGVGYAYLPWEAALFCSADFVVRGRVFAALAAQQGIETCWISVGAPPGQPGQLFAMGVLVGNELLLFEPKLGLPIFDPTLLRGPTCRDATTNPRVLRRLSLPQYEYAFDQAAMQSIQLLMDAVPFAASRRAKLLEAALLGDERMNVHVDLDQTADRLGRAFPKATVALWHAPLLAQLYAEDLGERLNQLNEFTMRYMAEHAIWLLENAVATGRQLHLAGRFENTLAEQGALKTYIDARIDDESLSRLTYHPDIQKALGLFRGDQESKEQFEARIRQAQLLFSRSKFDVAFMLAQLHFDRGDYAASVYWLRERVLNDARAQRWHAPGWYTLARALIELERYQEAEEALTRPEIAEGAAQPPYVINPQDAGNRLRLRFLRRHLAQMADAPSPEPLSDPE